MGLYVGIIVESQVLCAWLFYCLVCSAYVVNILGHRLLLNRASLPWQRIQTYIILRGVSGIFSFDNAYTISKL